MTLNNTKLYNSVFNWPQEFGENFWGKFFFWQEGIFCIISEQDPERVLSFAKILLILWCHGCYTLDITYLVKVFSLLSLKRNLENFTTERITTTLISCIVMWLCTILVHTPPYYPSVGNCIVCFSSGLSTTSIMIDENQLHTFFLYITHRCWSCYGNKKIELRISKFILL